jgi:uncharacterized Zn-finger protein
MNDKAAQLRIIKEILKKKASFVECDGCSRSYLPMTRAAQAVCPLCGHDHSAVVYEEVCHGDDDLDINMNLITVEV